MTDELYNELTLWAQQRFDSDADKLLKSHGVNLKTKRPSRKEFRAFLDFYLKDKARGRVMQYKPWRDYITPQDRKASFF